MLCFYLKESCCDEISSVVKSECTWVVHEEVNKTVDDDVAWTVMNIEWDYSYYQPWSDNEWLVDEMIAMQEEALMAQNENITMQ